MTNKLSGSNWDDLYAEAIAACERAKAAAEDLGGWSGSSGHWPLQEAPGRLGAALRALREDVSEARAQADRAMSTEKKVEWQVINQGGEVWVFYAENDVRRFLHVFARSIESTWDPVKTVTWTLQVRRVTRVTASSGEEWAVAVPSGPATPADTSGTAGKSPASTARSRTAAGRTRAARRT